MMQRQPRFLGSSHLRLFSTLTIIILVSSAVTFIVSSKLMMLTVSESQYSLQSILPHTSNSNNQSQSKGKGPLRVIALCACRCISNDIEKTVKCDSFYNHTLILHYEGCRSSCLKLNMLACTKLPLKRKMRTTRIACCPQTHVMSLWSNGYQGGYHRWINFHQIQQLLLKGSTQVDTKKGAR